MLAARPNRPALLIGALTVGVVLAVFGWPLSAHAGKVGVAAAVKPEAFSGGTEVRIGNSIFYNQRINTTGSGLVQVLLVDGSTFTVGPGSDLVIDKFVYDPDKKQGEMVASFGKGVLRFVGGKLSKNDGGVTINTPPGSVTIRGGMFQGKVAGHSLLFSFLYGVEMKFTGKNGQVSRVYQPGYTLDYVGGIPVIRLTRPEDTQFFMQALAGGSRFVLARRGQGTFKPKHVDVSDITEDGTQDIIYGQLRFQQAHQDHRPPTPPTPPEPPDNTPPDRDIGLDGPVDHLPPPNSIGARNFAAGDIAGKTLSSAGVKGFTAPPLHLPAALPNAAGTSVLTPNNAFRSGLSPRP